MDQKHIKNFDKLATTENRRLVLEIAETGFEALDTENAILRSVKLDGNTLSIMEKNFDLTNIKNIKVVGFGKASSAAAKALEKVLGSKIKEGVVIGIDKVECQYIESFVGTHPRPSADNVVAGKKIYELLKNSSGDDLIIALVSGGGSALLCSSEKEREQGVKLYESFLKTGKTISVLNTVRKHLSILKGGGLAKIAHPATVIGLIFSDIPGNKFNNVASGPTYKDLSTVEDAEKIIAENNLGQFKLLRTPKDDKYFEKVYNFVLVSNKTATQAMADKAKALGLGAEIVSTELYDEMSLALDVIFKAQKNNTVIIGAGEPGLRVPHKTGRGGRNLHMGLTALYEKRINKDSVFLSFASDGRDNSDAAGAIVDENTLKLAEKMELNARKYLMNFDSYVFFQATGDMLMTGPTGANVSDLMILLSKE